MNDPTAGEVGGVFAGLVGVLVAIGHGLKWWLGWTDRRAATRAAKLDVWQAELTEREHRFDARQDEYQHRIEAKLEKVMAEHGALFAGYQLLASALRVVDPENDALRRADELLRLAFPLEGLLPPTFSTLVGNLDKID